MNAVMNTLVTVGGKDFKGGHPSSELVRYICEKTLPGSKLRQFMITIYVEFAQDWKFEDEDGPLPSDFLAKVAEGMSEKRPARFRPLVASEYHEMKKPKIGPS